MSFDMSSENITIVLRENPQSFALKIFDREKQPSKLHPCANNPCQDLCLIVPNDKYVCKCRDGREFKNGRCEEIPNWSPPTHCRDNEFQCKTNLKCIDKVYT